MGAASSHDELPTYLPTYGYAAEVLIDRYGAQLVVTLSVESSLMPGMIDRRIKLVVAALIRTSVNRGAAELAVTRWAAYKKLIRDYHAVARLMNSRSLTLQAKMLVEPRYARDAGMKDWARELADELGLTLSA